MTVNIHQRVEDDGGHGSKVPEISSRKHQAAYNRIMSLNPPSLIVPTEAGLYCPAGDFHIDPWRPVERAVVTHAHADHACWGCGHYLTSKDGLTVLRARVGEEAGIGTLTYGEALEINEVRLSLHPAGHILGSSQVRVEHRGEVCVVSGDYKTEPDLTCTPFEPIPCHTFISECTFGLPIYRWPTQQTVFDEMDSWWRAQSGGGQGERDLRVRPGQIATNHGRAGGQR